MAAGGRRPPPLLACVADALWGVWGVKCVRVSYIRTMIFADDASK